MRTLLHLLTTPPDALTRSVLENQQSAAAAADRQLTIVDWSGSPNPDYEGALDLIFQADSVSTW